MPLELDADLRPEGRNGPLARSLDAYAEYYRRWALSWEAQALLRARGVAGSVKLIDDFMKLADQVRYPERVDLAATREIKRIKARVESERLPQGVDPSRHLKLGPGVAERRRVARAAAAAAARARGAGDAHHLHARRPARRGARRVHPDGRRGPAGRGLAPGEPPALGQHAPVGPDQRRAARSTAASSTASAGSSSTRRARPRRSRRTTWARPAAPAGSSRSCSTARTPAEASAAPET